MYQVLASRLRLYNETSTYETLLARLFSFFRLKRVFFERFVQSITQDKFTTSRSSETTLHCETTL